MVSPFLKTFRGRRECILGSSGFLFEGSGIFAYVGPPHVVERAGPETVHAFAVVGPDDYIGEDCAFGEEEDGVRVTALGLFVAGRSCCSSDSARWIEDWWWRCWEDRSWEGRYGESEERKLRRGLTAAIPLLHSTIAKGWGTKSV